MYLHIISPDDRHGRSVQTRVIVVDFTSGGGGAVTLTEKFDAVRRGLAGLDVAVLVNNAGVANPRPDRLLDMTAVTKLGDPCHDIIECNALAAVAMCRVAMPLMLEGGHRCQMLFDSYMDNDDDEHALLLSTTLDPLPLSPNTSGGVVINIGSISAHIPLPLFTVYTATKVRWIRKKISKRYFVKNNSEVIYKYIYFLFLYNMFDRSRFWRNFQ